MIFNIERYVVKQFDWLARGNRPGNSLTFFLREFTREHLCLISVPDEWIAPANWTVGRVGLPTADEVPRRWCTARTR